MCCSLTCQELWAASSLLRSPQPQKPQKNTSKYPGFPRGKMWRLENRWDLLSFLNRYSDKESLPQPREVFGVQSTSRRPEEVQLSSGESAAAQGARVKPNVALRKACTPLGRRNEPDQRDLTSHHTHTHTRDNASGSPFPPTEANMGLQALQKSGKGRPDPQDSMKAGPEL